MTTNRITEEQLAELEWLDKKAMPGPWHGSSGPWLGLRFGVMCGTGCIAECRQPVPEADRHNAAFIAAARGALPALVVEVRRLQKLVADYEASEASQLDWIYRYDR